MVSAASLYSDDLVTMKIAAIPADETLLRAYRPSSQPEMTLMLTQKRLREILHYDPQTGIFTFVKGRRKGGSRACSMTRAAC